MPSVCFFPPSAVTNRQSRDNCAGLHQRVLDREPFLNVQDCLEGNQIAICLPRIPTKTHCVGAQPFDFAKSSQKDFRRRPHVGRLNEVHDNYSPRPPAHNTVPDSSPPHLCSFLGLDGHVVTIPPYLEPLKTHGACEKTTHPVSAAILQPATTQGLPLVGGSVPGNPKAPPPCARAGVRGWSPRAFKFSSADAAVAIHARRAPADRPPQSRSTRPRYRTAAVTPNSLPTPCLPWSRMTAGGDFSSTLRWAKKVPPAFSFQFQGRSRWTIVCGARRALQGVVSGLCSNPCRKLPWR